MIKKVVKRTMKMTSLSTLEVIKEETVYYLFLIPVFKLSVEVDFN